jgi:hypothetical protein
MMGVVWYSGWFEREGFEWLLSPDVRRVQVL